MKTSRNLLKALGVAALLGAGLGAGFSQTSPVGMWDVVLRSSSQDVSYTGNGWLAFNPDGTLDGTYILSANPKYDSNSRGGGETRGEGGGGSGSTTVHYGGAGMHGFWSYDAKKVVGVINAVSTVGEAEVTNAISFSATVKGSKLNLSGRSSDFKSFTFSGVPYVAQPTVAGAWNASATRNGQSFVELLTLVRDDSRVNSYTAYGAGPGYYLKGYAFQSAQKQMSFYFNSLSEPAFADPAFLPASIAANPPPYMVTELPYGGIVWTQGNVVATARLNDVAFGNGIYVAVGGGVILNSYSGTTWIQRHSGIPESLKASLEGVAYGNGTFVAVGSEGLVRYSTDGGVRWIAGDVGSATAQLTDVSYNGFNFVAVGSQGQVFTSPTGTDDWQAGQVAPPNNLNAVEYTGTNFGLIAVGGSGTISGNIMRLDEWGWHTEKTPNTEDLLGVGTGANGPVVVGANGTILIPNPGLARFTPLNGVVSSPLLPTIVETNKPVGDLLIPIKLLEIKATGGVARATCTIISSNANQSPFATTNFDNQGILYYSQELNTEYVPDQYYLSDWFLVESPAGSASLRDIVFNGSQYVAVGDEGTVLTSPTAEPNTWAKRQSGSAAGLYGVAANAAVGQTVAVGDQSTLVETSDGSLWYVIPNNAGSAADPNGTLLRTVTGPLKTTSSLMRGVEGSGNTSATLTNILYRATKQ